MHQQKPAKRATTIRIANTGYKRIADRAQRADVDISHMVRRMLAYADQHMPDGWTPHENQTTPTGK